MTGARRRAPRITETQRSILVAMATRDAPLLRRRDGRWFVRDWGASVATSDVSALADIGFVLRAGPGRDVLTLSNAGRNLALNACSPETRMRLGA
jgi:hypothetical protein